MWIIKYLIIFCADGRHIHTIWITFFGNCIHVQNLHAKKFHLCVGLQWYMWTDRCVSYFRRLQYKLRQIMHKSNKKQHHLSFLYSVILLKLRVKGILSSRSLTKNEIWSNSYTCRFDQKLKANWQFYVLVFFWSFYWWQWLSVNHKREIKWIHTKYELWL